MLLPRASYPECIFGTSGLSGNCASPAPHQPKHHSLLLRKWLSLHGVICRFTTQVAHISPSGMQGDSRNPPPLQIAEKQLGLFSHWCISFIWEGKLCVYEGVCVCACACTSCDRYTTIMRPSSGTHTLLISYYFCCIPIQMSSNFEGFSTSPVRDRGQRQKRISNNVFLIKTHLSAEATR